MGIIMTSNINLTGAVLRQSILLSEDVKRDNANDVSAAIVQVAVNKAKYGVLSSLISKVDEVTRPDIEQILQKIQRKLQFTDRVIEFLTSKSKSVDPRLEALYEKLAKLGRLNDKLTPEQLYQARCKLEKYRDVIAFLEEPNAATQTQLPTVKNKLKEINLRLLSIEPQMTVAHGVSNPDEHYEGLQDIEACKAMSSIAMVKCYFDKATARRGSFAPYSVIEQSHQLTAQFLLSWPPGCLPESILLEDLIKFEASYSDFSTLTIPKSMLTPAVSLKDPQGALMHCEFLIELARTTGLKSIGAIVTLGSQHFALMFHSEGEISLFVPSGDKERNGRPYQVVFGNLPQAATFLSNLVSEKSAQSVHTEIIPVCLQSELREAELQRDPTEAAPSRSSSSSSLVSDDLDHPVQAPLTLEGIVHFAVSLQKAIDALSPKTEEGFFEALSHFQELENATMSDEYKNQKILDRIYFHLYHIQNNETPQKVNRSDHNYGMNAFQTEGLSTPEEKLRAVQRVQVEVMLELVDQALNRSDSQGIQLFFGALEKLRLDPRDLPKGQTNVAHALFGKLYGVYVEARKTNANLVDPNSAKFKGDFGRNAFCDLAEAGLDDLRKAALKDERQALKDTWKI